MNIFESIKATKAKFRNTQKNVSAWKQKRQVKRLQSLREKRINLQSSAKLSALEMKERKKIEEYQGINRENTPLKRFGKRVRAAKGRLEDVGKTVQGTAKDNKYPIGTGPEYGHKHPGWDEPATSGPNWGLVSGKPHLGKKKVGGKIGGSW